MKNEFAFKLIAVAALVYAFFFLFIILFHTVGVAIHEYAHCFVEFAVGEYDCSVVFFNPWSDSPALGVAFHPVENSIYHKHDHVWIYPLEVLFCGWLSFRFTYGLWRLIRY